MVWELLTLVVVIAFILEFFDASAGMGYGILTPVLLLMGFAPLEAISAVLITSAGLSLLTGGLHHGFDNIDFLVKKNYRILGALIGFGIIAIVIASLIAVNIPSLFLRAYIGLLIVSVGIYILIKHKKKHKFSWKRLIAFGSLASFNKGLSGGGYGPVLSGGQIVSGVKSKEAVGITALTEGVISLIGFLTYFFINGAGHMNWLLITALLIGGVLATPLAVYFVSRFHSKKLKYFIGIVSIIMGMIILLRIFLDLMI